MFSKIRKRLTFTNVALALVLVFAMTGGAYAAKKYVITSTKQISPAVLKQLQGKAGSAGTPGAQGPAGPAGPAGTNGTNGTGKNGQNGANGNNGSTGSTGGTGPKGPTGETGKPGNPGIPGTDGATGPTGSTGPTGQSGFTAVLPSGKTEKGTWVASGGPETIPVLEEEGLTASISFSIPLDEALEETKVHIISGEVTGEHEGCPKGSKAGKPEAEPGNLCVFIGGSFVSNVGEILPVNPENGGLGAGTTGTWLAIKPTTAGKGILANGTWAVTAK